MTAGTVVEAGLSSAAAAALLARHGPNSLPEAPPRAPWRRWLEQFRNPLAYILLFALAVDVVLYLVDGDGVPLESLTIATILLLNAGLGVWQETKAEGALAELRHIAAPQVWVLRDGVLRRVPSAALVPGDVVRVAAGDRVPADAVLEPPHALLVDESVITGESLPVSHGPGDPLLAGSLVAAGSGRARVVRTGSSSALGRLATMLATVEAERTPLERRLARFAGRVARGVLALTLVIAVTGIALEGTARAREVVLFAVALAVAVVPEGLPAVLTLTLALGVQRMARRRAVVRKLVAVEALGSVTVIATDKTGTLTENRLEVHDVDAPDYDGAVRAMVLAVEADAAAGAGDPIDLALLRHAERRGDPAALRDAHRLRSARPFDSGGKFTRATVEAGGRLVSYLKGAPEILLGRCDVAPGVRTAWLRRIDEYAQEGFRLLGLAQGEGEREDGLTWLGVVLLWDPPRPEVADAVRQARRAGIRVLMLTGDHPGTARTVARLVGIEHDRVVTGAELDRLPAVAWRRAVAETHVFARVDPGHKLRIVEALQGAGQIVAVTGDGVNDAPALKRADVGVAMGLRGSDVSREAADLVLLDDNFATIVAAIAEGRGIYENIAKSIRFLFSTNLSEVLVVTVGAFAAFWLDLRVAGALLLPLTAVQLLWINLVSDGAPALALGLDRNPGAMERAPLDPSAPLLDRPSLAFVAWSGACKAAVALAILGLLPGLFGQSLAVTASATFLFVSAGQLLFAYPARRSDLRPPANPLLHAAVLVSLAVQPLLVVLPGLRGAFGTVPLTAVAWLAVAGGVALSWAAADGIGRLVWSRGRRVPA